MLHKYLCNLWGTGIVQVWKILKRMKMQRMTTLVSLHLLKNNHAMLLKDCLLFFLLREIEGTVFCPYKTNDSMKLADVEIIVHVLF